MVIAETNTFCGKRLPYFTDSKMHSSLHCNISETRILLIIHGDIVAMGQASYNDMNCHHSHRKKLAHFDIGSFELFSTSNVEFNCCLKGLQKITYGLVLQQKGIVYTEKYGNRVKD